MKAKVCDPPRSVQKKSSSSFQILSHVLSVYYTHTQTKETRNVIPHEVLRRLLNSSISSVEGFLPKSVHLKLFKSAEHKFFEPLLLSPSVERKLFISKFFSFFPFHFTSCRCPASPFDPIVQNMLKNCVSISTGIKPLCSSRGWIVFWEEEYIGLKLFLDCMMKHCTCILMVVQINCYSERRN